MSKLRTESVQVEGVPKVEPEVSPEPGEDIYKMIAEAAYYRAEQRGFSPGDEMVDWLEAEKEILSQQEQETEAHA